MRREQRGFSGVEIFISLVMILVVGFVGWYVWKINHKAKPAASSSVVVTNTGSKASKSSADPTADWLQYTNAAGQFSFKYPKTWVFAAHPEQCAEGGVLMAANKESVGTCASEGFGQMSVYSNPGDLRNDDFFKTGFTNVTETNVMVDGVAGVRQSGTATAQEGEGLGAPAAGTVVTRYVFYTHNRTYVATYQQTPAYPNVLADFELLVNHTMRFSS